MLALVGVWLLRNVERSTQARTLCRDGGDRQGEAQRAKKNEHNVQVTVQRFPVVIFVLG